MAIFGDVCTCAILYSVGQVARPGDGPGPVQKAISAKNDRNHRALPPLAMFYVDAIEDIANDFIEFVRRDVQGSEDGLTNRQVGN